MSIATKKIYTSYNYKMFRVLTGNRMILERHKNEIVNSIKKYGYISNPIAVNERMEVIDGQHRLAALKELGLPVEYYFISGGTAEACSRMNMTSKNWTTMDFIRSNADLGNINFKLLQNLIKAHPKARMRDVVGLASNPVRFGIGVRRDIQSGSFILTYAHYEWADSVLISYERLADTLDGINAYKDAVRAAVMFILTIPCVDVDRLLQVLSQRKDLRTNGTVASAVEEIESIYNRSLRSGRMKFKNAWETREHLSVLEDKWKGENHE